MVIERGEEGRLVPAEVVAVAGMANVPSDRLATRAPAPPTGKLQLRGESAVVEPSRVAPAESVPVLFDGAVPPNAGVLFDVIPSLAEGPVSLAAASAGVEGAGGSGVEPVTAHEYEALPKFPAWSVALSTKLCPPATSPDRVTGLLLAATNAPPSRLY